MATLRRTNTVNQIVPQIKLGLLHTLTDQHFKIDSQGWVRTTLYDKMTPHIYSTCRKQFPVISPFMTFYRLCNWSNESNQWSTLVLPWLFNGVRVAPSLVFYVVFCRCCLSFFWPLYLLFLALRILITPLESSNCSCDHCTGNNSAYIYIQKYFKIAE